MHWKTKVAALAAACVCATAALASPLDPAFERARPSADARVMARWALDTRDHGGKPFLIVDKKAARLFVFEADGRLLATTHVLLGATRGDHAVPGVGERAQTGEVAPDERTTPAGRYLAQSGRNLDGEHVIWIDYAAALAIHRVRPGRSQAPREARLASASPDERRVSLGCIVVPAAFYTGVIEPLLDRRRGVVYVLPEMQSVRELITQL